MSEQYMQRVGGGFDPHPRNTGCDNRCQPVVVISPEDREQVERLMTIIPLRDRIEAVLRRSIDDDNFRRIGDHLQAALREFANPTPPRIEEPGTWGVVEASCVHSHGRRHWVKGGNDNWYPVDNDEAAPDDWGSLINPVLIREGVQP